MHTNRITVMNRLRSVVAAFGWAIFGVMIFTPLTLLAGSYYAILCALLYGKVVIWGEVALHWGVIGIASGGLLGFAGRLIDDVNPLASEPIHRQSRQTVEESRRPTFVTTARDLVIHAFSVRRHT
jgi:hypothetical protein